VSNVRNYDSGLSCAAAKYLGGWHNALLAAGLLSKPRRSWSKDKVLEAIRLRAQQNMPLTSVWKYDSGLGAAANLHFGCWRNALAVAGFPAKPRKYRQRHIVKVAIEERQEPILPHNSDCIPAKSKKGRNLCRVKPSSAASSNARCKNAG
jgi:hypothetical protein